MLEFWFCCLDVLGFRQGFLFSIRLFIMGSLFVCGVLLSLLQLRLSMLSLFGSFLGICFSLVKDKLREFSVLGQLYLGVFGVVVFSELWLRFRLWGCIFVVVIVVYMLLGVCIFVLWSVRFWRVGNLCGQRVVISLCLFSLGLLDRFRVWRVEKLWSCVQEKVSE